MTHPLPVPIEDELAAGIAGRLARLNGLPSIDSVATCFWTTETRKFGCRTPRIWQLAKSLGMDEQEFSHRHSMLTALFPVSRYLDTAGEASATKTVSTIWGMQTPAKTLRWCPNCVQRDIETLGFGIWRRKHQLVGVDICREHGTPLHSSSKLDASRPPNVADDSRTESLGSGEWVKESNAEAVIRFESLMTGWLTRRTPIRVGAWASVVKVRCKAMNIRVGNFGSLPRISDLLKEQMPLSWLHRHLPEVATIRPKEYVGRVDGATSANRSPYSSLICTAILAVLFPTAEEAIDALEVANWQIPSEVLLESSIEMALREFENGSGLAEAAQRHDVSLKAIETALREMLRKKLGHNLAEQITGRNEPDKTAVKSRPHSIPIAALKELQLAPCQVEI